MEEEHHTIRVVDDVEIEETTETVIRFKDGKLRKHVVIIRDFTLNTAKSGLSVGEKTAFWCYSRVRDWSTRWFTHIFLLTVVMAYSVLGAAIFVAVEGPHEDRQREDIFRERKAFLHKIRDLSRGVTTGPGGGGPTPGPVGPLAYPDDEQWEVEATASLRDFEQQLYASYALGVKDSDKKVWGFWNAVFFCGTVFTTIGEGVVQHPEEEGAGALGIGIYRKAAKSGRDRGVAGGERGGRGESVSCSSRSAAVMASGGEEVEDPPARKEEEEEGDNKKKGAEKKGAEAGEGGAAKKRQAEAEEGGGTSSARDSGAESGESPRRPPERKERAARRAAKKDPPQPSPPDPKAPADASPAPPQADPAPASSSSGDAVGAQDEALPPGPTPTAIDGDEARRVRRRKVPGSKDGAKRRTKSRDDPDRKSLEVVADAKEEQGPSEAPKIKEEGRLRVWLGVLRELVSHWRAFLAEEPVQREKIRSQRNRCIGSLMLLIAYVGMGGIVFRFTEGAFEAFYKCGVKRVKRDFVDGLWSDARALSEDEWKSRARRRLMELEGQLHAAYDAGVTSYSGQRAWSFLNAVVYCLTVVTTIGYGHIAPATTTGRAITIAYAILGIPMFLILLADFGKLFTRGIKFLWAFVRRVYYTGSCKKVRRTGPVQEVMKGVQLVYDFATFRRPSQVVDGNGAAVVEAGNITTSQSLEPTLASPERSASQGSLTAGTVSMTPVTPDSLRVGNTLSAGPVYAHNDPGTPAGSTFEVDDEFNLPISVAIFILLLYIFFGATIYYSWEEWGFFESFYFVFISMSTIGFGDYVPQHPMYMMASIIYLVFGLALTSMCINVVQEKLSDSFRHASAKLGATMGLQVMEEEEAAAAAQKVELAEVHSAGKKQSAT